MPVVAAAAAAVAARPTGAGPARPLRGGVSARPCRRRGIRAEASSSASASASTPAPAAADEGAGAGPCPVVRFEMGDFDVADRVSVGLHGRSDEMIFEATVRDPSRLVAWSKSGRANSLECSFVLILVLSELYGSTVVLRQLMSFQAKRRGRRALEVGVLLTRIFCELELMRVWLSSSGFLRSQVLKKLARRQMMYHSYAMQVHGYVTPGNDVEQDDGSFILVHGYHGSYSLRHWLQLSDWLPTLEATLALDEEQVRRVGDDSVGGPAVTRQLRLIRILMRDLLIGVNYLHSHGLAHTELRLENVHVSPIDKHVKMCWLHHGKDGSERANGFFYFPKIQGDDPACLREFLLPILCRNSPSGNIGLQMLDRQWGAGWNLLALLLATKPDKRISCVDALRHPFLCGPKWRINPSVDVIRWGLGSTAVRMAEDYIYGRHQRRRLAYFVELMEVLNPNPRTEDGNDSRVASSRSSRRYLRGKWRKVSKMKELPASLPTVNITMDEQDVSMSCNSTLNVSSAQKVLQEIRTQTPPEMFDLSKIVCGTYVDARLMILRGVNGSALFFTRSNSRADS
uniref:Protein kinase domain-containing protein n=1 Tax=Oryza meridionalis TaxID=40149 RepID=A0A0E0C5I2_9ORYZ